MPEISEPTVVPGEVITEQTKKLLSDIMKPAGKQNAEPAEPPMWAVILWNDNSTNPYFVIKVLVEAFKIPESRAGQIMMATHLGTKNVVAIMSKDEAETRLSVAEALISNAVPDKDWYTRHSPSCELKFSIEEETKGT